jgi:hypothetical protein
MLAIGQSSFAQNEADPYYYSSQQVSQQIDNSQNYLGYLNKKYYSENQLNNFLFYKYDSVWMSPNLMIFGNVSLQNGFIGSNYQRIQIYIGRVHRDENNPVRYLVYGKSKVKNIYLQFPWIY